MSAKKDRERSWLDAFLEELALSGEVLGAHEVAQRERPDFVVRVREPARCIGIELMEVVEQAIAERNAYRHRARAAVQRGLREARLNVHLHVTFRPHPIGGRPASYGAITEACVDQVRRFLDDASREATIEAEQLPQHVSASVRRMKLWACERLHVTTGMSRPGRRAVSVIARALREKEPKLTSYAESLSDEAQPSEIWLVIVCNSRDAAALDTFDADFAQVRSSFSRAYLLDLGPARGSRLHRLGVAAVAK